MSDGCARASGALVLAVAVLVVGCGGMASRRTSPTPGSEATTSSVPEVASSSTTSTTVKVLSPDAFAATDALLAERVRSAGLAGGVLRIVRADGSVVHESTVGSVNGSTLLSVASSTKWLTAATFMTLFDAGLVGLDDDISRWLPEFAGSSPAVTARQLLTHTSGVRDNPCQGNGSPLSECVRSIAAGPREFPAGTRFSYGNSDFLVVGRLIEVVGGSDFASIVQQRLTGPLGMSATTWPGAPNAANPAFGVRVNVDDYGKFLDMLLHRGTSNGMRVLSESSVAELIRNQVGAYDTSRDFSVGITKIPRYGLGCWPDDVAPDGTTVIVSGNGGQGFYPWVDYYSNTWGVVGVQDDRGATVAVPASQKVELSARRVLY